MKKYLILLVIWSSFLLISVTDAVITNKPDLILKIIESVWCQTHYKITDKNNSVSL